MTKVNNIVFAIDAKYIPQLLTVVNSILINSDGGCNVKFHVCFIGNESELLSLKELVNKNFQINDFVFYDIEKDYSHLLCKIKNIIFKNTPDHLNFSTYCRMFYHEILPKDIKIYLHLDVDLLVLKPIQKLFDVANENTNFAGFATKYYFDGMAIKNSFLQQTNEKLLNALNKVLTKNSNILSEDEISRVKNIFKNVDISSHSFNAGVFLFNRNFHYLIDFEILSNAFLKLATFKTFAHGDEGYLNLIYFGNYYDIGPKFNYLMLGCAESVVKKYVDMEKFSDNYIIHFNGGVKPWSKQAQKSKTYSKFVDLWKHYEVLSK